MRSYLLIYFRHVFQYDRKYIAGILDVTVEEYRRLESGRDLMTREESLRLGKLYLAPPELFLHESRQLHAAYTKIKEIILYRSLFREVENEMTEDKLFEAWQIPE